MKPKSLVKSLSWPNNTSVLESAVSVPQNEITVHSFRTDVLFGQHTPTLSWPNNTSVLQSAVMEEESLVADGAESGESVDTAAQSSGYPHHPMA
jgi:hypothetical protein